MKNRITELFSIQYPLIQGGMIWCSGWELASSVSNATSSLERLCGSISVKGTSTIEGSGSTIGGSGFTTGGSTTGGSTTGGTTTGGSGSTTGGFTGGSTGSTGQQGQQVATKKKNHWRRIHQLVGFTPP